MYCITVLPNIVYYITVLTVPKVMYTSLSYQYLKLCTNLLSYSWRLFDDLGLDIFCIHWPSADQILQDNVAQRKTVWTKILVFCKYFLLMAGLIHSLCWEVYVSWQFSRKLWKPVYPMPLLIIKTLYQNLRHGVNFKNLSLQLRESHHLVNLSTLTFQFYFYK